jgi:xylulokinase
MFLGIDVGSQSLKAVLLDAGFRRVGQGARPYAIEFPRPGWAEQAPLLWEKALRPAVADALLAAEASARDVVALGIAGQLDGCVPVDANGHALGPCLIWMDRRADRLLDGLRQRFSADSFRRRTGANLDGSHMAPKMRWQRESWPAARAAVRFHQPVSYLVERLTGEAVMDHGLASTSLVYDLVAGDFAPDLLAAFDLERSLLPRLERSEAVGGYLTATGAALTGLPRGLPVAVGTGDDFSTPLGGGIARPGIVANVLGTAEVVGVLDPRPLIDEDGLVETHRFVGATLHYIENPGWLSGGALEWLRWILGLADFTTLDEAAARVPAGAEGLIFLPALSGAMTPEWIADARGAFYGLTPAHGPGHLARAVLEGTAYGLRDVVTRLGEMGVSIDRIRALGGGARSRLWTGIRADITGLPVERAAASDSSAVGAAILAAVAARHASDLASAARAAGTVAETIDPRPENAACYEDVHARYRQLFAALKPMFGVGDGG